MQFITNGYHKRMSRKFLSAEQYSLMNEAINLQTGRTLIMALLLFAAAKRLTNVENIAMITTKASAEHGKQRMGAEGQAKNIFVLRRKVQQKLKETEASEAESKSAKDKETITVVTELNTEQLLSMFERFQTRLEKVSVQICNTKFNDFRGKNNFRQKRNPSNAFPNANAECSGWFISDPIESLDLFTGPIKWDPLIDNSQQGRNFWPLRRGKFNCF